MPVDLTRVRDRAPRSPESARCTSPGVSGAPGPSPTRRRSPTTSSARRSHPHQRLASPSPGCSARPRCLVAGLPSRDSRVGTLGRATVATVLATRGFLGLAGRTDLVSPGSDSPRFRRNDRAPFAPLCLALAAGAAPARAASRRARPSRTTCSTRHHRRPRGTRRSASGFPSGRGLAPHPSRGRGRRGPRSRDGRRRRAFRRPDTTRGVRPYPSRDARAVRARRRTGTRRGHRSPSRTRLQCATLSSYSGGFVTAPPGVPRSPRARDPGRRRPRRARGARGPKPRRGRASCPHSGACRCP